MRPPDLNSDSHWRNGTLSAGNKARAQTFFQEFSMRISARIGVYSE